MQCRRRTGAVSGRSSRYHAWPRNATFGMRILRRLPVQRMMNCGDARVSCLRRQECPRWVGSGSPLTAQKRTSCRTQLDGVPEPPSVQAPSACRRRRIEATAMPPANKPLEMFLALIHLEQNRSRVETAPRGRGRPPITQIRIRDAQRRLAFFSLLAARFSSKVFAGFFFSCFFCCSPLAMSVLLEVIERQR